MNKIDFFKLLNTAVIKSREKKLDVSYEDRLKKLCNTPAIEALGHATSYLSHHLEIPKEEAALMLVETIKELDNVWYDYVAMEGIEKLKKLLEIRQ